MRKVFVMISGVILLVSATNGASGQRCIKGLSGIQAAYSFVDGINTDNYNTGVHISTYTANANKWFVGFDFMNRIYRYGKTRIPLNQFTAEGGYYFKLVSDRRKIFFLSAGISGMAGYELVNKGEKMLPDGARIRHDDTFIYGGALGCELECYITDKIIILLFVKERVLFGSTVEKFHTQMGTGLKFIIN